MNVIMPPKRKKLRGRKSSSFGTDHALSSDEWAVESLDSKSKSPTKPTRTSTRKAASRAAACITATVLQESLPRLKPLFPRKSSRDGSCPIFGKVLGAPVELERHLPVHSGEWPFQCHMCSKSFKYKKCIERHILSDHKTSRGTDPPLTVGCKRKGSESKREIQESASVLHGAVNEALLDDRGAVTSTKTKRLKSYPSSEVTKKTNSDKETKESKVLFNNSCVQTNRVDSHKFTNNVALTCSDKEEKLRKMSEQLYRMPSFDSTASSEADNFTNRNIRKRILNRTCQFCGKVCPKPSDLQRHLMKHTGEQPFQCDLCQRRFKAKPNLLYHLRSAHGKMINLSPALVAKFANTKKYKQDYHCFMHYPGEWNLETERNVSDENTRNEVAREVGNDAPMPDTKYRREKVVEMVSTESKLEVKEFRTLSEKSSISSGASAHSLEPKILVNDKCGASVDVGFSPANEKVDQITGETLQLPSNLTKPGPPQPLSSPLSERNCIEGDDDGDNYETQVYSIASLKDWDGQTPSIVKYKVNPRSEEVLVTRMIGMNLSNGEKNFLYKCHWCTRVFLSLHKLQSHLTIHVRRSQKTYVCFICGEIFQLKSQLRLHSSEHVFSTSTHRKNSFDGSTKNEQAVPVLPSSETDITGAVAAKVEGKNPTEPKENGQVLPGVRETAKERMANFFTPEELSKMVIAPLSVTIDSGNCVSNLLLSQEAAFSPLLDLAMPALRLSEDGSRVGYHCHYCDKIFDRVFSLNRHERVHTGIKACYCKECGRGFSEPRNLRHHIIRFHSDGSQRHLLRRCSYKDDMSLLQRAEAKGLSANENCMSHLKEMGIPHCTSPDLSSGDSIQEVSVTPSSTPTLLSPKEASCNGAHFDSSNIDQIHFGQEQLNTPKTDTCNLDTVIPQPDELVKNLVGEDSVTVIYPTDVPENTNDLGIEMNGSDLSDNGREILSDPKRSLIGNLRKQKPHRNISVAPKELEPLVNLEPNNIESTASSLSVPHISQTSACLPPAVSSQLTPPLPPVRGQSASEKNNNVDSGKTDSFLLPINSGQQKDLKNWNLGSIVSGILSPVSPTCLEELKPEPRKRKRKVNNGYFNYSPRLNVVEKPVQRADVCKPRILPDGRAFYECCYCHKKFGSVSDINRHMDFHEDVRPYKCQFCNYYSRTNSQLKVHMMRHQGIKQYLCEVCHYCGVTQSDLNRHKKTQAHCLRARNVCKLCGLGYFTRQQKVSHMLSYHLGFAIAPEVEKLDESVEKLMLAEASACFEKGPEDTQRSVQTEGKITTSSEREGADKPVLSSELSANAFSNGNRSISSNEDSVTSLPAPVDFSLPSILRTGTMNGQLKTGTAHEMDYCRKVKHPPLAEHTSEARHIVVENKPVYSANHAEAQKYIEVVKTLDKKADAPEASCKYVEDKATS